MYRISSNKFKSRGAIIIFLAQKGSDYSREVINLRGSLPKSGPLDLATKNSFPLFFVGEEALVGVY